MMLNDRERKYLRTYLQFRTVKGVIKRVEHLKFKMLKGLYYRGGENIFYLPLSENIGINFGKNKFESKTVVWQQFNHR